MDKIILKNIRCTGKRSGSYGNRRRSPKCSYKVGCFGSDTPVRGRTSTLPNPYFYFHFYFLLYPKHTHTHTHTHTSATLVLALCGGNIHRTTSHISLSTNLLRCDGGDIMCGCPCINFGSEVSGNGADVDQVGYQL